VNEIRVIPVAGIREIEEGDDVGALIVAAFGAGSFAAGDAVVVAHKVVSKSEGRVVNTTDRLAVARAESARVLRRVEDMIVSETRHGFVCANAGVDASNVPGERVALLPEDPDASARRIRARIRHLTSVDVAVIVSDTFGRAWRLGQTNVAIGVAGMEAFTDYRGRRDAEGRELSATRICTADELAGAAELVMGKTLGVCAAVIRGAPLPRGRGSAAAIVRPVGEDLFR
jgi:coenzyme F420-0:L-glutamate ligase/coenzyme F420-1:gamma-L-glutamate ligase